MTIKSRTDGRYEGRITINNIRKSFYGRTKTEVKQKAKEYLYKIENGFKEPQKISLNDYIEYWLKNYKLNKIEPTSYSRLYSVYIHQIKDTIGKKKIGDVTTKDIQELIDNRANPISNNTKALAMSGLKKILQLLRSCFNIAIKEEIVFKNPCDNIILPKESCIQKETKKQFSLNDEEILKFRDAALSKYTTTHEYCSRDGFILLFIMNLGLRVGEALALEWDDFDFINKIVYINKTIQSNIMNYETGKIYTLTKKSTKTHAGVRILHLNDNVLDYLRELKEYDIRHNILSKYLCCTHVGTINTARNLQRSLDRILKKANIDKKVTLHTLRHTFGSVLLRNGVNIEVVSKLMGHANINITYNKYIHAVKEEEAKAMKMIKVC